MLKETRNLILSNNIDFDTNYLSSLTKMVPCLSWSVQCHALAFFTYETMGIGQ